MGMSRIFWDTNLFIYFLEGNSQFSLATKQLRKNMLARGDQLLTSTLTLGELLVKPMERGDAALCRTYEQAISQTASLLPFDGKAAWNYAAIRRDRSLRAPDAVQLACAATANTDLFVTNDHRLQGKQVAGIQFIVPLDKVPI
jgi:predicted nucleic acid-binding protein